MKTLTFGEFSKEKTKKRDKERVMKREREIKDFLLVFLWIICVSEDFGKLKTMK